MAGALMNHSAYSADRATHLKIVVAALVASMLIVGFASYARFWRAEWRSARDTGWHWIGGLLCGEQYNGTFLISHGERSWAKKLSL
jgi:hypothetical protein